ncbi:MAG: hypothetical protein F6K24_42710 [Okeania sp. SIO2D1]|nr:hypothetical protein [Okeania sp. SIO2D1]
MVELGLRLLFGFGNPPIYIADEEIGYLLAPNQKLRRMGNQIAINEYSMRSPSLSTERSSATLRILLLGDSVANGGWWTDQEQTISVLTEKELLSKNITFEEIEILNASANSWGPRNQLAYLQRFGLFDTQVIILLINTDDLFATAPTPLPVGNDRNYPAEKPPLALAEIYRRYLVRPKPVPGMAEVQKEGTALSVPSPTALSTSSSLVPTLPICGKVKVTTCAA